MITRAIKRDAAKRPYGKLSKKNQTFIRNVLRTLKMDKKIKVKSHKEYCHAMVFGNVLSVNEALFDQLTDEEKKFIIAHEAMHYILEHCEYKTCYEWTGHGSSSGYNGFSRALEKEADLQAAKRLKCAKGGVKFFQRLKRMWGCSYWNKKDKNKNRCTYDPEHPTFDERLGYLKPIAAKQ